MTTPPPAYEAAPDEELSVLAILNVLLKRWKLVLGVPFVIAVLVVAASYLVTPMFTATTSFVPETRAQGGMPAGLAGLAGQFGLAIGGNASQSPQFYAEIAKSRPILDRLLESRYANSADRRADSITLLQVLEIRGRSRADMLERGAKRLASLIRVGVNAQTNVVSVSAELPFPELAAAVANRLVAYLNEFNSKTRQSQARERRKFTEQQVARAEQDLRDAENALKRFYQTNRSWQQAPQLMFEEGRLRRQVELRQEIQLTLRRELEMARIEEVNDTPVITVVAAAHVPQRKSSPTRRLWGMVAFALTGVLAVVGAFIAEHFERARLEGDEHYAALALATRRLRENVRRVVRAILPSGAARAQ